MALPELLGLQQQPKWNGMLGAVSEGMKGKKTWETQLSKK